MGDSKSYPRDADAATAEDSSLAVSADDATVQSEPDESVQLIREGLNQGVSQELSQLSLSSDLMRDSELIVPQNEDYSHLAKSSSPYDLVVNTNTELSTSEHPSPSVDEEVKVVRHNTGFARKKQPSTLLSPMSSKSPSRDKTHREPIHERDLTHHNDLNMSTTSLSKLTLASPQAKTSAQDLELYHQSAQSVQKWASMTHIYALHSMLNDALYSLELVSKQGDISVAQRVPLDRPLIRIGTHSSCECVVTTSGAAKRDSRVAKIHCLFYCPPTRGAP
eukprot:GDKK01010560.1.p1 GENE.GDKK01010560.1~~GDKK01010560.1.p1  ORF type:complete len:278 (-),score=14.82 GDKK01010560.1:358-1191(-)